MTLKTSSRFLGFVCIRLGGSCSVVTSGVFLRRFWGFGWVSNCLQVAREAVLKFRPGVDIVAHHGNVKNAEFDIDFFKQFSVVLNGLDNLEARRHVNRLCLAAGVPLVESGTTGYLGQVTVHIKGKTECYECQPKPAPKSYPVCTITSTPSKVIFLPGSVVCISSTCCGYSVVCVNQFLKKWLFFPGVCISDAEQWF
jgi:hypothetical protein